MKITLKRKLVLKSAVLYLELETKVEREDVKNYLNGGSFSNPLIEKRVKNYLEKQGIFDSQFKLTTDGEQAKQTGLVKEKEEGKYQIWYTQGDALFGNRIFHFKRIEPSPFLKKEAIQPLGIEADNKPFCSLPVNGKDGNSIEFFVGKSLKESQGEKKQDASIDCTWSIGINESSFTFNGTLQSADKDGKINTDKIDGIKPVDLKIPPEPHFDTILPNLNGETKRCKFKIEDIKSDDAFQYFEYTGNLPVVGFSSCHYDKLPIEPYNLEEAGTWRNKLLDMELEKQYLHHGDFYALTNAVHSKNGLKAFENQLEIPAIDGYIAELDSGQKSKRTKAYWHLAAPRDLNVDIPQKLKGTNFSLTEGEKVSFENLVQKFGSHAADKVFYYDRFVFNYRQQRSVYAFLKCFNVPNICVITNTRPDKDKFSDYISKKEGFWVEDMGTIFKKDAFHDRFIVFKSGNDLTVWKSSNSIDFIRFDDISGEIPSSAEGTVTKGGATYTQVDLSVLGEHLTNYMQEN
ncbi:MAG: hypothetical protein FWG66_15640 [Spirochaetes bacterium]|nr:hypothetical protein [Spirochaetota bacterium]